MPVSLESPSIQTQQQPPLRSLQEGYRELFSNKPFMALWLAQVFSQLADRIIFVVFITLIVSHFGTQGSLKSGLYIAFTIPAILLTAVAGVFVDRWHRQRTLVLTNILRAGLVALIPLAIQYNSLLALYACAFGISVVTQFFVPAESATIPMVTRSTQLMVANSLFTTTMMGSVIFGFVLGDPLIEWLGLRQVHWAIVALFLLSAACLSMVKAGKPPRLAPQQGHTHNALAVFLSEMKEGVAYLKQNPMVLRRMLKLSLLFSSIVAMCIVFISYAEAYLYADPKVAARKFAWIIAFSGFGMVGGALIVGNWFRQARRSNLVYSGFTALGMGLLLLTLTPQLDQHVLWPSVLPYLDARIFYAHSVACVLGLGAAFVAVPLQAVLQEIIPETHRGKVMGVQFTLLSTCSTLPALIAGFGADMIGVLPLLAILGFPLLWLGIQGLISHQKLGLGETSASW